MSEGRTIVVKSLLSERFWPKVTVSEYGCWLWQAGCNTEGYGILTVRAIRNEPLRAHRVSWFLAHGAWPTMCVLHRCDVRTCVRPDHLFEGSRADNTQDMMAKGRHRSGHTAGEHCNRAKLTWAQVSEIRRQVVSGQSQVSLAREHGITKQAVSQIVHGRIWTRAS